MLAPTSMMTIGPRCEGKIAAIPGRRTPGRNILAFINDDATIAPVWPAETTASTSPAAIKAQHLEIELSRFLRRASTGFSSIPITWLAWTTGSRERSASGCWAGLGLDRLLFADQDHGQVGPVFDSVDGTSHDRAGLVVAAHRVQGNPHWGTSPGIGAGDRPKSRTGQLAAEVMVRSGRGPGNRILGNPMPPPVKRRPAAQAAIFASRSRVRT